MEDSIETLYRLQEAEYPLDAIPPHYMGVFLITDPDNPDYAGLGKSNPQMLTEVDPDLWTSSALFSLDCEASDTQHPIGTFIGLVGSRDPDPDTPLFLGILISPTGVEAEGMYIDLRDLSKFHTLWEPPFDAIPYLEHTYQPLDRNISH